MSTLKAQGEKLAATLPILPVLDSAGCDTVGRPTRRLPEWLKRPIPAVGGTYFTRELIAELGLETICESARCPNRSECWTRRTATFMILGDICTRPCGFCAVQRGHPEAVVADEPDRLAEACARLGLRHVVITSVTRDDLPDGGAEHFRRCILEVRARTGATVEALTPDFDGDSTAIDCVLSAAPEVFNHNLETVARLQQHVRRKSQYEVSLKVLAHAKRRRPDLRTKSGLMLGLGETIEETIETLADLRSIGCDFVTLGQYLQPSPRHLPVVRYLAPDEFNELGRLARALGFARVASGPFVRSSYHADEMALA
jgi:lipoic acid synthetase